MNIESKFVEKALSKDCAFIFEALKILEKGTCGGDGKVSICTWDLLPKIKEALLEHIAFEEKWIFQDLPEKERELHQAQHEKLVRLLAKATWELEFNYGDQFRSNSSELIKALQEHHRHDGTLEKIKEKPSAA